MKIAIIPARGGSKRIPRKNIQLFNDLPIIAYSIQSALKSGLFNEVIVSTDDKEIADIAIKYGAKVPFFRSAKNADDHATTADVLLEVIEYYLNNDLAIDFICCLYPTAPLIEASDLIAANEIFQKGSYETLISSVQYSFPIQRAFRLDASNKINLVDKQSINMRSQDLEKTFHDAGAFYFLQTAAFLKYKSMWEGNIGAYILPEIKVQDIDTAEDWKMAELKYQLKKC